MYVLYLLMFNCRGGGWNVSSLWLLLCCVRIVFISILYFSVSIEMKVVSLTIWYSSPSASVLCVCCS